MFNSYFISSVFIFILFIIVEGFMQSYPSHQKEINDCLNIELPDNTSDFGNYRYTATEYYNRPYNIYIHFKADSVGFDKIIIETKLISYESDFKKNMCLDNGDNFLIKKL